MSKRQRSGAGRAIQRLDAEDSDSDNGYFYDDDDDVSMGRIKVDVADNDDNDGGGGDDGGERYFVPEKTTFLRNTDPVERAVDDDDDDDDDMDQYMDDDGGGDDDVDVDNDGDDGDDEEDEDEDEDNHIVFEDDDEEDILDASNPEVEEMLLREEMMEQTAREQPRQVYVPDPRRHIPKNYTEQMEPSWQAYDSLHRLRTPLPLLSLDVVRDNMGDSRTEYPFTAYFVGGSQAPTNKPNVRNAIYVFRASELHKTLEGDDVNDDDDDDENDFLQGNTEIPPRVHTVNIPTDAEVNRIKCMPQESHFVAGWVAGRKASIEVHNIANALTALDEIAAAVHEAEQDGNDGGLAEQNKMEQIKQRVLYNRVARIPAWDAGVGARSFHKTEGFAIDWSRVSRGKLATGDMHGFIQYGTLTNTGYNVLNKQPMIGHTKSVEDIQWSPMQDNIFASCSADGTVCIWDARNSKVGVKFKVSDTDVNVISWNRHDTNLLVSGDDHGIVRVWDMSMLSTSVGSRQQTIDPVAQFDFHRHPITSIAWDPNDADTFVTTSDDDMCTIWNLSVEADKEADASIISGAYNLTGGHLEKIPPQLLFVHMGQQHMKEVHWHEQIPGLLLTTAANGVHIFKPINMGVSDDK